MLNVCAWFFCGFLLISAACPCIRIPLLTLAIVFTLHSGCNTDLYSSAWFLCLVLPVLNLHRYVLCGLLLVIYRHLDGRCTIYMRLLHCTMYTMPYCVAILPLLLVVPSCTVSFMYLRHYSFIVAATITYCMVLVCLPPCITFLYYFLCMPLLCSMCFYTYILPSIYYNLPLPFCIMLPGFCSTYLWFFMYASIVVLCAFNRILLPFPVSGWLRSGCSSSQPLL
jgi:hypothetical protein